MRRADTSSSVAGVARARGRARLHRNVQSKHRATYGDDEAPPPNFRCKAARKAALLRAKESLSTGCISLLPSGWVCLFPQGQATLAFPFTKDYRFEYNGRGYAVLPGVDIRCHACKRFRRQ